MIATTMATASIVPQPASKAHIEIELLEPHRIHVGLLKHRGGIAVEEGRMSIRVVIIGRAIEEPVGIQAGPIETVFEDAQMCRMGKNASGISGSMRRPQ